jgi:anti-sigma B factor antagonist
MFDFYDSEIELIGDVGVLTVAGETDLSTSSRLRRDLDEAMDAASGDLILDLSDLDLVDSTALRVMLAAAKRMMAEQRALVLVVTRRHVLRVFDITGLRDFFSITSDRREAMASAASDRLARRAA